MALTPNLDRLHGESVRYVDFHGAPMCTPTRGQLLTGLDGALNVSSGRTLMRADLPTMADVFQAGGYCTGIFGQWHLGDNHPYRPQDRGFEESVWSPSSHISSLPDYWENDYFDDVYCHNGDRTRFEGYCTEVFFDHALERVGERAALPTVGTRGGSTGTGGHFAANEHLSGSRAACRVRRCLCGIPVTRQVGALGGPSCDFILHGR